MADEISVSMHIGSGKNAINNMDKIKRADLHNNRKYKNNKNEQIDLSLSKYNITLAGTKNITEDMKNFYKSEFAEAVYNYNQKQEREDRKIVNYLEKMNNDTKTNIAVEFIFQIGDKKDWEDVSLEDKEKTAEIFKKVMPILEKKGIKTVNASLHLDETSPHLHLIAVPIIENQKRGLEKQVSQNKVITKSLIKVVRKEIEETLLQEYNKIYGTDKKLKRGCEIEEHLSVEDYKDTKKILEVAKKVGDRKEFKRELDINLSELDEDLKNLKEEIETKKEEQSKLTRLEKELDIVIKELKREKEEKEKEIADLQENVKSKEEIETELKEKEKDLLEIKNKVDKINESVEFSKEELESAENSLNAIQNNIDKQYLLESQLKDKINEYNRINEELNTKTIEVKEIEEKVKANDEIMSIYKTKINSFDDDLEKIKKEAEEKKKEKEEEETLLQTRKKELEEIQNNRTNIENLIRQAEEKKKANTEKRKELQELEEQEKNLETAIKDKKNSIKENTDILKELETEEKIVETQVNKKAGLEKERVIKQVLNKIEEIDKYDIWNLLSENKELENLDHSSLEDFKNDTIRYVKALKRNIDETRYIYKDDENLEEEINNSVRYEDFEIIKKINEISVEDYGFKNEEIKIDKGRGYGD
ncbi:plasmid recombination protein [Fusobacterium animalis]|uniref:plasmid recombination protein n=1 Tax=Fusobacterium animalis TaxID=76859 RepID=UPI0030CFF660